MVGGWLPPEWAIQERARQKEQCFFKTWPYLYTIIPPHIPLVIQIKPDEICEGTTQGYEYKEVRIIGGHLRDCATVSYIQYLRNILCSAFLQFMYISINIA